jgi:hypothetical protein
VQKITERPAVDNVRLLITEAEEQRRSMRAVATAALAEGWTVERTRAIGTCREFWGEIADHMDEIARQEVRKVAGAMLAAGYSPDYVRTIGSEEDGTAASFREFAGAMEELLTEGCEVAR